MRRLIRELTGRLGYEVRKRPQADPRAYDSFPEESRRSKRFYNIGAGTFSHPYWTNVDYATEYYRDAQRADFIHYDLMELEPLPVEDESAELVYSSHTIEHVSDEAVRNMLREAYRILKPGGGIRLTTPNAWLEFQAYQRGDRSYWYWADRYSKPGTWEALYRVPLSQATIHQLFLHHFASQLCEIDIDDSPTTKVSDAEIIEAFAARPEVETLGLFTERCRFNPEHPGNHINWWTHEKAAELLREAGFSTPRVSGWGQSVFVAMRDTTLFDSTHPRMSMYIEAVK